MRDLTPRQRQIAEGLARGLSYSDVAVELGISVATAYSIAKEATLRIPNPHHLNQRALLILWAVERKKAS